MMLSIGDVQVSVQPVPGSISESMIEWAKRVGIPTSQVMDHPLFVGDHEVTFYEVGYGSGGDHWISAITSEVKALNLVASWMVCDEGPGEWDACIELMREVFGAQETGWLMP
jgi:hypothetical protein